MFSPSFTLFALAVFYLLILIFIGFSIFYRRKIPQPKNPTLFLFFLSLFIRFIPAYFFPFAVGYDISSFIWAGEKIVNQEDIYTSLQFRHRLAALPAYPFLVSFFIYLAQVSGFPLLILLKIIPITADALIPVVIYRITKNIKSGLLYSLFPIGIIISALMGQFESLPLLFSLLSLYFYQSQRNSLSLFSLGYGAVFKPWPLILAPMLILREKKNNQRIKLTLISLLPSLVILLMYLLAVPRANLLNMFYGIALYTSGVGWWGLSQVTRLYYELTRNPQIFPLAMKITQVFVLGLILVLARYFKKTDVFTHTKYIVLIIYCLSFGLAFHYLLWIFPFALITKDTYLKKYLLYGGSFFIFFGVFGGLNYNFLPPAIPPAFYPILSFLFWLFFVLWLLKESRKILRDYILRGTKV